MNLTNPPSPSDQPDERPIQRRWTEKETAQLLHMAVCTLRRKRKEGLIGYYQDGGKIFYDETQIRAYQDKTRVDPKVDG